MGELWGAVAKVSEATPQGAQSLDENGHMVS
jgi:hypothetical protein